MGMRIVPSVMMDDSLQNATTDELTDFYGEDLPSPSSLQTELHLWKCKWRSSSQPLPDTPADALMFASESMFPNIHSLLRLVCTIPVTSCECERSVSVLRRLKTYLRSSMGQERLSGLALMHIQYSMEIDYEEVINIFARKHPRRMMLADILASESDSQELHYTLLTDYLEHNTFMILFFLCLIFYLILTVYLYYKNNDNIIIEQSACACARAHRALWAEQDSFSGRRKTH